MGMPREVFQIHKTDLAVNTNLLAVDQGKKDAEHNAPVKHIMEFTVETVAAVIELDLKRGAVTQTIVLLAASVADKQEKVEWMVHEGDTYNIQYSGIAGPMEWTARITEIAEFDT